MPVTMSPLPSLVFKNPMTGHTYAHKVGEITMDIDDVKVEIIFTKDYQCT